MKAQCGKLGPVCMAYLESTYNSTSLAAAINNLGAVVRETIVGPDQIAGVAARNKRFARLALAEDVLVALILLKLPDRYSTIKTMIIQSDTLPTIKELIDKLQTEADFFGASGGHSAFSGIGQQPGRRMFCFNCDEQGHNSYNCTKAKAACEECDGNGHLSKHCFVRNDKPLPAGMSAEKKQLITEKRAAYKAAAAAGMATVAGGCYAEAAQIKEDEDFLAAMQRLGY